MNRKEYTEAIVAADPGNDELFCELFARGLCLLALSPEECARVIDVSRASVKRWASGATKPHPVVRKIVFEELHKMATEQEGDAE